LIRFCEIWIVCLVWLFGVFTALSQWLEFTSDSDEKWWSGPAWMIGGLGVILPVGVLGVVGILHWFKVI
jgi:hypothetical protein